MKFMRNETKKSLEDHKNFQVKMLEDLKKSEPHSTELFWKVYNRIQPQYVFLCPPKLLTKVMDLKSPSEIISTIINFTKNHYEWAINHRNTSTHIYVLDLLFSVGKREDDGTVYSQNCKS
eukprot:TRINITY_DN14243_c0_g1_i1.p2 TRINITY_DN14243_c0_g1~~TRINITY_DN14243_c0_g1_i1.p2  ORF type:complete len:120 (+),score=14.02 TRINITY_DN14243_c0_g1_i1:566-925(+)